jgi:hypothetical protein
VERPDRNPAKIWPFVTAGLGINPDIGHFEAKMPDETTPAYLFLQKSRLQGTLERKFYKSRHFWEIFGRSPDILKKTQAFMGIISVPGLPNITNRSPEA